MDDIEWQFAIGDQYMRVNGVSASKRLVALVSAGVPLTAAAWLVGLHGHVFIVYNLLLAGLFVLDYCLLTKPEALTVRRVSGDTLYFKTDNDICFYVENRSHQSLQVHARDDLQRHFTLTGEQLIQTLPPGGRTLFSYTVLPAKRGRFTFERIDLRYTGRGVGIGGLGLCVKYASFPCPIVFKVYPNLKDLSKYRLLIQKNRLLPRGERTVRLYGAGVEYEHLRAYVEGDDFRKINWKATARENRLIVNQYQTEKNQPVFILLDAGRPMSYDVGGYKKLDYAINAALILSDIVNRQGDHSGLMVFDAAVRTQIMPGKGAAHRNRLMEALYRVEDNRLTADYEGAFRQLCERQKRRALIFIFTDFEIQEEAESLIAHIALLKRRHRPVVVFMKNEGLHAMANGLTGGLTDDPIDGLTEKSAMHTRKDRVLRDTARAFLAERTHIFRMLNAMGIPNVESTAEAFAVTAVNKYLTFQSRHI